MDIEKVGTDSGMLVMLDGRIGSEEYKSVYGSLQAFQCFANGVRELVASETCASRIDLASERLVR